VRRLKLDSESRTLGVDAWPVPTSVAE
jgi:hypothetical protein